MKVAQTQSIFLTYFNKKVYSIILCDNKVYLMFTGGESGQRISSSSVQRKEGEATIIGIHLRCDKVI